VRMMLVSYRAGGLHQMMGRGEDVMTDVGLVVLADVVVVAAEW
jgi:hypothetical protein